MKYFTLRFLFIFSLTRSQYSRIKLYKANKKTLFIIIGLLFHISQVFSQDVITKKTGEDINSKVIEIGINEVRYKKFENIEGPTYSMLKSDILMIRYENGTKEIFNKSLPIKESTDTVITEKLMSKIYSMKGFAASINPLGFLQFGPMINLEYGITDDFVLNVHWRFPALGYLTKQTNYDDGYPEKLTGWSIGGGVFYHFKNIKNNNRAYLGLLYSYYETSANYQYQEWPSYHNYGSNSYTTYSYKYGWNNYEYVKLFYLNGGYRFRYDNGFFINIGAYLGIARGSYSWSDYSEGEYNSGTGKVEKLYGMLELSLGWQFTMKKPQ